MYTDRRPRVIRLIYTVLQASEFMYTHTRGRISSSRVNTEKFLAPKPAHRVANLHKPVPTSSLLLWRLNMERQSSWGRRTMSQLVVAVEPSSRLATLQWYSISKYWCNYADYTTFLKTFFLTFILCKGFRVCWFSSNVH